MVTNTDDNYHQNIAFERMRVIVEEVFNNGIFVDYENEMLDPLFDLYPEKLVLLPKDACDQVVGMALFHKINAVMEKKLICYGIRISSKFGDNVWYQFGVDDNAGVFNAVQEKPKGRKKKTAFSADMWWNRSDLLTMDLTDCEDNSNAIWEDIGLGWECEDEEPEEENAKNGDVIDLTRTIKKFQGKVIKGGKKIKEDD